jgi:hypothetical protein
MKQKQTKATKKRASNHPRHAQGARHEEWKRKIGEGVRRAKMKRRKAGYLTARDISYETGLPLQAVYSIFRSQELAVHELGQRRYVHRSEWKRYWRTKAA